MRISCSKLTTFITCPLKYKLQYVEKIAGEETYSSSIELGKYVHKVMENYREGLNVTELAQVLRPGYTIAESEEKVAPTLLEQAVKLIDEYRGIPFESESHLKYTIPAAPEPIECEGIIDKLYHFPDGRHEIIDFKTGKYKVDNTLQMKFYTYLLTKTRDIKCEDIKCKIFYLRLKQNVNYSFNQEQLNEFEYWLTTMCESINRTDRYKHNFNNLCRFCQYRNKECIPFKSKAEMLG